MAANATDVGHWVEVDDSDANSNLVYSEGWIKDTYEKPGPSTAPGDLNRRTAHGTANGSFTFRFEGAWTDTLIFSARLIILFRSAIDRVGCCEQTPR